MVERGQDLLEHGMDGIGEVLVQLVDGFIMGVDDEHDLL